MKQILSFIKTYVILVILFVVQKPLFLLLEKSSTAPQTINIWDYMPQVIWHGLSLDLGMAGYLSVIPGLLLLVSIWIRKKLVYPILNIYFGIVAFMGAFLFALNLGLYPYWNFPLDSTPLFYFFTSPKDALASVSFLYIILAFSAILIPAIGVWFILRVTIKKKTYRSRYTSYGFGDCRGGHRSSYDSDIERHRLRSSLILLVLTALLFLPIRGGVTVSTNNTGKAYFVRMHFLIMQLSILCSVCLSRFRIRKILQLNIAIWIMLRLTSFSKSWSVPVMLIPTLFSMKRQERREIPTF